MVSALRSERHDSNSNTITYYSKSLDKLLWLYFIVYKMRKYDHQTLASSMSKNCVA